MLEECFFSKDKFFKDLDLFHDCKTTDLGLIFFHKKIILYFFSSVVMILMQYLKHYLRIYLGKLWKIDFTLLIKPLELCKLLP